MKQNERNKLIQREESESDRRTGGKVETVEFKIDMEAKTYDSFQSN